MSPANVSLWLSMLHPACGCPSQSLTHEGVVSPGSPRWEASAPGVGVREAGTLASVEP